MTDDPGVKDALTFLMTREISHQQSFEKALYSMQPNFPPGKLAGMPEFTNVYFNMSVGEGDTRGPWNNHGTFEFREAEPAVDGGSGMPEIHMSAEEADAVEQAAIRLHSDPDSDPMTGAMLGMDGGGNAVDGAGAQAAQSTDPMGAKRNAEALKGSGSKAPAPKRSK